MSLTHNQRNKTRSIFLLQELWGKFTGWGCWSVSPLHGPPLKSIYTGTVTGPNQVHAPISPENLLGGA